MNTAVTALYAADPFLLSDAPGGNTKPTMSLGMRNRPVAAAMLTGSVTFDDAVENATKSASETARTNVVMRMRAPATSAGNSMIATCMASAMITTTANVSS